MNQRSKGGGQANGNSVNEARRGATRPAVVVAIVLCVGFAVAMVAIWSCGKPRSNQEMQAQPKATVQNEIPKPEADSPIPVQTEIPKAEADSRFSELYRSGPLQPSTAAPVSQANPAARQSMADQANSPAAVQGDQVNSPTPAPGDQSNDFSHELNAETVTFEAFNPTTKVPGRMTATVTGIYHGNWLWDEDGQSPVGSHLQADQRATFIFVSDDRYAPSYSATATRLQVAGDTTDNTIHFDFGLAMTGSDGSSQRFTLREIVTVTEDNAQVAFQQLK